MEESKKSSNGIKILIVLLILLMIVAGVLVAIKFIQGNKIKQTQTSAGVEENKEPEKEVIKLPTTFAGKDRPIAVMIDNNINAMPQAGLLEADLVYEIIVEGGETRMMAVLKGKDVEKIGPVRSSRHYFLDYALENDAIYVHFGWSPQAESDISTMGVNNINGLYYDGSYFWRVSERYAPHNAVISTKNILKVAENNEYRTTSEQKPVLNYVADEIELEDGKEAETITIPYSDYNTVKYTYNEDKKEYVRYSRGKKQVDWNTDTTITTKNIIVTFAENYSLNDGSGKGRQGLENIGKLKGYYITNGKAIEITCEKNSRTTQTVYKDLQGNEIKVNDGKTFMQICPLNANVKIEGNTKTTEK